MLSLFTLRKILFSLTVGGAIAGPIIATSPAIKAFQWSSSSVSPLKEGLINLQKVDIYDGESINSFLQRALIHSEGQEGLIESFSQELSKKWYLSQPQEWINSQITSWDKEHEKQFQQAWEKLKPVDAQRDFWDNYWGSKESMNSFGLRFKSYELVKKFLTDVKKTDFKLNEQLDNSWDSTNVTDSSIKKYFTSINYLITSEKLKTQSNWSKIGFFPTTIQNPQSEWEKVIWGKYDFINWSYKKWFNEKLPIYFWKISWNYDKSATKDRLQKKYNPDILKQHFPSRANYEFPLFSESTKTKFKEFIQHLSQKNTGQADNSTQSDGIDQSLELEKYHVPAWFSDSKTNGEILELFTSFKNSTPEGASALHYLLNKYSNKSSSDQSQTISQVSVSSGDNNKYDDPIELFLSREIENTKSNQAIEFNDQILKENEKQWKFSYDAKEVNNFGWIFFRDDQGIHAIQLDGYKYLQQKQNTQDLFNWFNFRNLQSTWADKMSESREKQFISTKNNWFDFFYSFLSENFNSLFTEYYTEKGNESILFQTLKDKKYFNSYTDLFKNLFALKREQKFYLYLFEMRKKIIKRYSKREWETTSFLLSSNSPKVSLQSGISSVFPYSVNIENNETRFPDQEAIINSFFRKDNNSPKLTTDDFHSLLSKYYESIKQLFSKKEIVLHSRSNGFSFASSQRIFIQDAIFDFLLDKLFSQKEFLNYMIKEEKLLNTSFFSQNKVLTQKNPSSNWDHILKIKDNSATISQVDNPSSRASESVGACPYTLESTSAQPRLEELFKSILKSYLFRQYLKNLDNDYFNFLVNFSNFKRDNLSSKNTQNSSTSTAEKLSDFELFKLWRKFSLTNIQNKSDFLDFLITLDYLTKNKFQNLRDSLKTKLSDPNKYHYLSFEIKESKTKSTSIVHPFLPKKPSSSQYEWISHFNSRKEMRTFIREAWKPGDEISKENINSPSSSHKVPVILSSLKVNALSNPDKNKNLFNFSDLNGLIQHIKNVTSVKELEWLASYLSTFNWRIYLSFYKSEKIFFTSNKNNGKTATKYEEKKLYLEDKKQALIYQILNTNENIYSSKIFSKEEVDKIFKDHVWNASFNESTLPASSQNPHLSDNLFARSEGSSNKEYFIQVSKNDFLSEEAICGLFNKLPVTLLSEFIIQQTDESLNQLNAQHKFFEDIPRLKIHDLKFKGHIDSRFRS